MNAALEQTLSEVATRLGTLEELPARVAAVEDSGSDVLALAPGSGAVLTDKSAIDICRLGARPGKDCTTALQKAIETVVALGGGSVYASIPGQYLINGPVKEGEVENGGVKYKYAGQILFPPRPLTAGQISVRLAGQFTAPMVPWRVIPGEPIVASGVQFLSNAAAGNVFDAIPYPRNLGGSLFTAIQVEFADFTLLVGPNPQCGGVNGFALIAMATKGLCVSVNINPDEVPLATHSTIGITMPAIANAGYAPVRDTTIQGFGVAVDMGEHTVLDNVAIQQCAIALQPHAPAGHVMRVVRAVVQECPTVINVPNVAQYGGEIHGLLDVEASKEGAFALASMWTDEGERLQGRLNILLTSGRTAGWPAIAGYKLNVGNIYFGDVGSLAQYPLDLFSRFINNVTGQLGTCDHTAHVWRVTNKLTTNENHAKQVEGTEGYARIHYPLTSRGSRTVEATLHLGAAPNVGLLIGRSNSNGHFLVVRFQNEKVALRTAPAAVELANAVTTLKANATADVKVIVTKPANPAAAVTITVIAGEAEVLKYELTAGDKEYLADTSESWTSERIVDDGIWFFGDTGSYFSRFAVTAST